MKWKTRRDGSYGPPQHWYFVTIIYCPLCGATKEYRERQYGKRPKKWEERYRQMDDWCGCGI